MTKKYNYHIIAIDDNVALLQTLKLVLGSSFEKVGVISNPKLINGILGAGNVDAVLLDMNFDTKRLDGSDGLYWLKVIKERPKPPAVILITAFGDINLAVESMKQGADDFVTKPWDNHLLIEKILLAIRKNNGDSTHMQRECGTLEDAERKRIVKALEAANSNVTKAADILGISRRTLYNKMLKYGL